jgi:hypothetical protein
LRSHLDPIFACRWVSSKHKLPGKLTRRGRLNIGTWAHLLYLSLQFTGLTNFVTTNCLSRNILLLLNIVCTTQISYKSTSQSKWNSLQECKSALRQPQELLLWIKDEWHFITIFNEKWMKYYLSSKWYR